MKKKIMIIEPPFYRLFKDTYSLVRYPLALGYLAGTIEKETDWEAMTYNADFSPRYELIKVSYMGGAGFSRYLNNLKDNNAGIWQEVKKNIAAYQPGVLGLSIKSANFASACIVAKIAKGLDDKTIVIVGGPHASAVGREVFGCPDIDICVRGEGEITIVELLKAIANNGSLGGIKGIVYKKNGEIRENPPRELISDLDNLCFPHKTAARALKDYEKYPITAFENIFAIRGCPFNCFFCGSRYLWTRRVRFRSPQNVLREIEGLKKKGLRAIRFYDDTFGVDKRYISDLCSAFIKSRLGVKWSCEVHVKLAEDEVISQMKAAGCYAIQLGVESGSNEILRKMRKDITIEEAFSACKIIKKHRIELQVFFMIGFPQETEDTLHTTLEAMKKIKCDTLVYSIFTPYPGTESFEFCREKGLIADKYDISLYNHQSPANCFCMNISPERFRALASRIEKMVDKRNATNRIKGILSRNSLWRIKELGMRHGLEMGWRILKGRFS